MEGHILVYVRLKYPEIAESIIDYIDEIARSKK